MAELHSNKFDDEENCVSPEEKFSNVQPIQSLNNQHTWSCLVYILDAYPQDRSGTLPKWDPRAQLDIYFGPS
eukprot:12020808-Ditylum_brightwellii.AAC.1